MSHMMSSLKIARDCKAATVGRSRRIDDPVRSANVSVLLSDSLHFNIKLFQCYNLEVRTLSYALVRLYFLHRQTNKQTIEAAKPSVKVAPTTSVIWSNSKYIFVVVQPYSLGAATSVHIHHAETGLQCSSCGFIL